MTRLLFDEDMNHDIIRGLVRRLPDVDYRTALDLDLAGRPDEEVLKAAAIEERLLVSHDINTMSAIFKRLRDAGETSFGLLLVPQSLPIGQAIEELELVCQATENQDWIGVMGFLPI